MKNYTEEQLEEIRDALLDAEPEAVGYRLMIRPLPARQGLEAAEMEQFETLNAIAKSKGTTVATKTDNQESRETHGSDVGIVVNIGSDAYQLGRLGEREPWCEVGDVVMFPRYCGHITEVPPGSGIKYHFMTDDDLIGKYKGVKV